VAQDRLRISVEDTGVGLQAGWSEAGARGIGVAAMRARLRLMYGDRHSLEIGPGADRGTRAVLAIPVAGEMDKG
jgi:LytS/YehU family sensor histidine kinase